jgi:rRNA-processing protein FCF1
MKSETRQANKTLKVILDSNAFFVPLQFKIDIFEELKKILNTNFEAILLSPIRREIERIAEDGSPQMRKDTSYVLRLIEKCKYVEVKEKSGFYPDDAIVDVAREWKCPVFTNDRQLRKRLRDINVSVIYVRQKSHLAVDGRL